LDLSGAILGYFVGFILTLTNYAFLSGLLVFFLSSSWATRYKSDVKKLLEEDFKKGIIFPMRSVESLVTHIVSFQEDSEIGSKFFVMVV
jgi:uncharacterized membrane protein